MPQRDVRPTATPVAPLSSSTPTVAFTSDRVLDTVECADFAAACEARGFEAALVNIGGGWQAAADDVWRRSGRCIIDSTTRGRGIQPTDRTSGRGQTTSNLVDVRDTAIERAGRRVAEQVNRAVAITVSGAADDGRAAAVRGSCRGIRRKRRRRTTTTPRWGMRRVARRSGAARAAAGRTKGGARVVGSSARRASARRSGSSLKAGGARGGTLSAPRDASVDVRA